MGPGVTIARPFGIPVRLDASWIIAVVLVSWSLAAGFFPQTHPALGPSARWAMALAGALGLFASILLHEFAHALVARRHGIRVASVTLFVFGGVGDLRDEPPTPLAEFWIAVAGPAMSAVLALLFAIPFVAGIALPAAAAALLHWLLLANTLLAAFNMLPAFPLDGGRVLRSFLWRATGSLRRATRVTTAMGRGLGTGLMALGGLQLLAGNWLGAVWFFFLGAWLRQAARGSYEQTLLRELLRGEPVRAFMKREPVTVAPGTSLLDFVRDYVYRHRFKMYPVTEDGRLLGYVTLKGVAGIPPKDWESHRVAEFVTPLTDDACVGPDADVLDALARMNRTGMSRLLVREDGRLVGILALKDVLGFFALKVELEGEAARP
jgi:Zn-dependent protease